MVARRSVLTQDTRSVSAGWRDTWLILGLSVLLFLVLEMAYRGEVRLRQRWRESDMPTSVVGLVGGKLNPYADSSWAQAFFSERNSNSLGGRWEPYVYYRAEAFKGRFFTIDSSGLRVTRQVITR